MHANMDRTDHRAHMQIRRNVPMGKMGRPKSDVVKDNIVTIRMSDEEYLRLKEYSKVHQQTITETIKTGVSLLYKEDKQCRL